MHEIKLISSPFLLFQLVMKKKEVPYFIIEVSQRYEFESFFLSAAFTRVYDVNDYYYYYFSRA